MTVAGHRRRLRILARRNAPPPVDEWMSALRYMDRQDKAKRAMIAFALNLAGVDKLPLQPALVNGHGPLPATVPVHAPEPPPPRQPPFTQKPRWTRDIRPGPHDVLTWEEAMQVPWLDPFKDGDH